MATATSPDKIGVQQAADTRIAAYLLTEYLERLGVEVVFGLCGHTIIALLDALGKNRRVRFVSVRHEQVAAHAADGYARASGKVGVVLTHLGPGLTNAATGVANAALDSIPLVVIAGDVPSYYYGRHPHQEVNLHQDADQFRIYEPFCKRVYRVDHPHDLPRTIERAFHLAQTGRPGPVLVDVPMDIFSADLPIDAFQKCPPPVVKPMIDHATVERIVETLASAKRPVIYAGGGVVASRAFAEIAELAQALEVPIAHTLMGTSCVPSDHPLLLGMTGFWGTPIANESCKSADVILAIGTRLAEANSSSWYPGITFSIPPTRVIHIDIDPAEIGRNDPTELGVVADAKLALGALAKAAHGVKHADRGNMRETIAAARQKYMANFSGHYTSGQYPLRPERILADLRREVPADGYIVTDVGWNKNGVGQQFPFSIPGTFITPSGLATMGFGAAAALGVKLAQPGHPVIALVGDGGFGAANPMVMATAIESNIPVIWVVMDNAAFGTIAGLEKQNYGWSFGCTFESGGQPYRVDFASMAKGCGVNGVLVQSADDFAPALRAALASGRPSLIQVPMENAPTPTPGHWNILDIYRKGE
jgi:acetolactate synthase I/II/III large subunit